MALEYASDEMKADKEVVLEEAKQNVGIAMKYASRNDNIGVVSKSLKSDDSILLLQPTKQLAKRLSTTTSSTLMTLTLSYTLMSDVMCRDVMDCDM